MTNNTLFKISDNELKEKFYKLSNLDDLANLLEVDFYDLRKIFYDLRSNRIYYKEFLIKKKNGGERKILAPISNLKFLQHKLLYILSMVYLGRPSVHGFIKGKNIITNAREHAHRKIVFNIDLEDFFPSIHFGRVRGILESRPYNLPRKVSTFMAGFCCYKGILPQGAPTSPIISNIVCSKLDYDLQNLAKEEKATYSRYADDITFSTTKKNFSKNIVESESNLIKIGSKLKDLIIKNGFKINKNKIRILFYTERQEVTGLVVNKFPNVKRSFIKQIRMMLHIWRKYGLEDANKQYCEKNNIQNNNGKNIFREALFGKLNFIKLVKKDYNSTFRVLAIKFNDLSGKKVFKISSPKVLFNQKYISSGERIEAIKVLDEIFSTAEKEICIADHYLTSDIVGIIKKHINKKPYLSIKLSTSKKKKQVYRKCLVAIKRMSVLNKNTKIDYIKLPEKVHGRFIIIDQLEVYQSGHSFMELGHKSDCLSRIMVQLEKEKAFDDLRFLLA